MRLVVSHSSKQERCSTVNACIQSYFESKYMHGNKCHMLVRSIIQNQSAYPRASEKMKKKKNMATWSAPPLKTVVYPDSVVSFSAQVLCIVNCNFF